MCEKESHRSSSCINLDVIRDVMMFIPVKRPCTLLFRERKCLLFPLLAGRVAPPATKKTLLIPLDRPVVSRYVRGEGL